MNIIIDKWKPAISNYCSTIDYSINLIEEHDIQYMKCFVNFIKEKKYLEFIKNIDKYKDYSSDKCFYIFREFINDNIERILPYIEKDFINNDELRNWQRNMMYKYDDINKTLEKKIKPKIFFNKQIHKKNLQLLKKELKYGEYNKIIHEIEKIYKDDVYQNKLELYKTIFNGLHQFAPFNIIEQIKNKKILYQYKVSYDNVIINVYTFEKINDLVKEIIMRLLVVDNLVKNKILFNYSFKTHNVINLYLYLIDIPKTFPEYTKDNAIFLPEHVNSALNYGNNIVIFRKEESKKTIIHEAMHMYKVDKIGLTFYLPPLSIKEYNKEALLLEAMAETMANILNLVFVSLKNNNFMELYNKELDFSFGQTKKILYLSNMTLNDIFNKGNNHIIEKTNVTGYFIIKMFYIYYVNEFINNIVSQNKNINILKINETIINKLEKSNKLGKTGRMTIVS